MIGRVSTTMIYRSMIGSLQNNLQTMLDLERQMTTQNKYSKISDNPSEIARALALEASLTSNTQYIANQQDAVTMLKYAETALDTAVDIIETIRTKVIYAGDGALGPTEVEAIATEIEALKEQLLDVLNTKVAGKYLFGGTNTGTKPFVMNSSGRISYVGSDERMRYDLENGLLGDVSFTGLDIMSNDFKSYFICSHYVPLDWQWTGREEKVQITVGNRTLSVFIPEQWIDEVAGSSGVTDYNQFRDPEEVSGISLEDVATLVNRALKEQGADMLVTATVEKDYASGQQRLIFKSNTGEPISVTGWASTDPLPMAQSVAGLSMDPTNLADWNSMILVGSVAPNLNALSGSFTVYLDGTAVSGPIDLGDFSGTTVEDLSSWLDSQIPGIDVSVQDGKIALTSVNGGKIQVDGTGAGAVLGAMTAAEVPEYSGLMGSVSTLGWKGDSLGKQIEISVDGITETFDLDSYKNISELVNAINARMPVDAGDLPFASLISGRLVLQSTRGEITVQDAGNPGGTAQLFGQASIASSTSSLTVKLGSNEAIKIYINQGDTLERIAEHINAIEGIYARTSADGTQLVVVGQRSGSSSEDYLSTNAAEESLYYPSFVIWGEGAALSLFDYTFSTDPKTGVATGTVGSEEQTRAVDHSHIDLFDYLGMETSLKSVEFELGKKLKVDEPLHWRVISGTHVTDITLNPGEYTMDQIAERLKNAGAGWLEVTVDVFRAVGASGSDDSETGLGTSANSEDATSRLVIRSTDGSPVVFLDMNEQRYAEQMGLSTAVRTDENTGVENIKFPSAPCLDDNLSAMVRIQMTCGKTYDVRLTKKDVLGSDGYVDRVAVMRQIAQQINAQAGEEVMKVIIPVDSNGKEVENAASLVAVTGEPFSVVDLPVVDPVWNTYSGGIAAQMGIHSGVTSIPGMLDNETTGTSGTIRFESLGRSVEIDVSAGDTVKDIMDRLRDQAGDWLYVNYFDAEMGQQGSQKPVISIAAKDGSAVNVIDVSGSVAYDRLYLSTGIQGTVTPTWSQNISAINQNTPTNTFSITVNGYTHTIDLNAMRDINGDGILNVADLVATINARMQDDDVRAELNADGYLVLWSPRGYMIEVEAKEVIPGGTENDITDRFLGTGTSSSTPYRGGYDLENASPNDRDAPGIYTQNVTARSGSNQTKQNFFGVIDDIAAAVRSENRDGLADKLLPQIDAFLDGLLKVLSTNGALQARYTSNISRMKLNDISMTEAWDSIMKVDLTEVYTQLLMAESIYESSLAVIARIVQPTLLDFLR